ncbi:GNAT family N-acetyltransferase [Teichococcus cervicalis]|uniref:Acetyltransferase, GNAT family n=1 Tax=Pseudoroseomonas cervicalis ATCC 49957 TaxID=525371 RepID=D5RH18_9PROT|nr:GNAT family N-acetyltransferase [Pseudoroseomonas cervicalis]EFH13397.1 acetyltransferase, GNAT family [Pseudoroseomonas cervicalis ATCC 49957]
MSLTPPAAPADTALRLRPATAADRAAIAAIILPTIRAGETYSLPQDLPEQAALDYWLGDDRESFVAEDAQGTILGTYYLRANQGGRGAHVCNCGYMTAAHASGRGVARAMCAHSLAHAKRRGYRAMQFNFVVSSNRRAVLLWQSMGFAVVGTLPGAFDHPALGFVDALVMFRPL